MTGEPPSSDRPAVRWRVVVPIKDASRAKSRLQATHPLSRPALARAVAQDTLSAVLATLPPLDVIVVSSDPGACALAESVGAVVVADPGSGLNAAVRAGLRTAAVHDALPTGTPWPPFGYAVLLGDLPALRPQDLRAALDRCAHHRSALVPDADGVGTVLLTSTVGLPEPHFGPGSAERHSEAGQVLALDLPHLRRDVDTAADLAAALALGVGAATAQVLARQQD